ncbi:MAG: hypothetical protein ACOX20_07795 [Limnochordia bacterium]
MNGVQAIMRLLGRRFEGRLVSLLKRLAGPVSGVCAALTGRDCKDALDRQSGTGV